MKNKPIKYSNKIKYKCSNCEHIEPYTKKEALKESIWKQVFTFVFFLGILALVSIIIIGPQTMVQSLITPFYMSQGDFDSQTLRDIGANVTKVCDNYGYGTDSFCIAVALFDKFDDIRYLPANHFDMISDGDEILKTGGDCKNVATLFAATMKSMGFETTVSCSLKENHCVAVTPHIVGSTAYRHEYAVIDLTIPAIFVMDEDDDIWDYQEKGMQIHKGFNLINALQRGYIYEMP